VLVAIWPWVEADGTINDINTIAWQVQAMVLCDHYEIPYLDVHSEIRGLLAQGHLITEYYNYPTDFTHPLTAGHAVAWNMLEPLLDDYLFGDRQFGSGSTLPARLNDSSAYEHGTETYINGTAYTSRAGTWTDASPQISSSSAGATVLYTFSGISFGVENTYIDFGAQIVDYRIDGGAWQLSQQITGNGIHLASYGVHTVEFRVVDSLTITHFVAV
jgi:hypothetical protein